MKNNNLFTLSMILFVSLFLSACGSSPKKMTFGDKLKNQGTEVQVLGEQWSNGEEMISEGKALIEDGEEALEDGESLVSKGRSKIEKGESMIRKGQRLKDEAERGYELRKSSSL